MHKFFMKSYFRTSVSARMHSCSLYYRHTYTHKHSKANVFTLKEKDITYHTVCYLHIHTYTHCAHSGIYYIYKHLFSHITPYYEDLHKERKKMFTFCF